MEITFKTKEHPEAKTVSWDLPVSEEAGPEANLQALVAKFGAESVVSNALANYVIGAQAFGRRHINKPDAELQELFASYDPNTRSAISKKSPFERAMASLGSLSAEEKAALLEALG